MGRSSHPCGLKISPALREYYRYTGVSEEALRHGFLSFPRPDFTRLVRGERREDKDKDKDHPEANRPDLDKTATKH